MSSERYPLIVNYEEASTSDGEARFSIMPGGRVIHGLYRIGTWGLLEVAIQYSPFPSFCGGATAHSPVSRVMVDHGDTWASHLYSAGGGYTDGTIRNMREAPAGIVDVSEFADTSKLRANASENARAEFWQNYGYRVLANGLFAYMAACGKRGIVMSGPDFGHITKFLAEAQKMTTMRKIVYSLNDISPTVTRGFRPRPGYGLTSAGGTLVGQLEVVVQNTEAWRNYNSGNMVRYFPIVLKTKFLGDFDFDKNARRQDQWNYNTWQRMMQHQWEGGGEVVRKYVTYENFVAAEREKYAEAFTKEYGVGVQFFTPAELEYANVCGDYIRRYNWHN